MMYNFPMSQAPILLLPRGFFIPDDAQWVIAGEPLPIPFAQDPVQAGFPSPAAPYIEDTIDLNDLLIGNQAATFMVRVRGESLLKLGVFPNDLMLVDRSLEPKQMDLVLVEMDNAFTVKKIDLRDISLHPENDDFPIIRPHEFSELQLVGVVTWVLKKMHGAV